MAIGSAGSVADTITAKLTSRGFTGSLQDMLLAYWKSTSGGMPAGLSVSDYQRGTYLTFGGSPLLSISDLEHLYYDGWPIPRTQDGVSLSLIDRERLYWESFT